MKREVRYYPSFPKSGGSGRNRLSLSLEREENRDKPAARNSRSCNTLEVVGWYACDYLLSHRRINDESPMGKPVAGAAERHAVLTTSLGPQHGHSNGTSSPRDAN